MYHQFRECTSLAPGPEWAARERWTASPIDQPLRAPLHQPSTEAQSSAQFKTLQQHQAIMISGDRCTGVQLQRWWPRQVEGTEDPAGRHLLALQSPSDMLRGAVAAAPASLCSARTTAELPGGRMWVAGNTVSRMEAC